MSVARHQSRTKNRMMIWAMAFAYIHRVPYPGPLRDPVPLTDPASLNLECFLPSDYDFQQLEERMVQMVARILCIHLAHFREEYSDNIQWHIPHGHSEESKLPSDVVIMLLLFTSMCIHVGTYIMYIFSLIIYIK